MDGTPKRWHWGQHGFSAAPSRHLIPKKNLVLMLFSFLEQKSERAIT